VSGCNVTHSRKQSFTAFFDFVCTEDTFFAKEKSSKQKEKCKEAKLSMKDTYIMFFFV